MIITKTLTTIAIITAIIGIAFVIINHIRFLSYITRIYNVLRTVYHVYDVDSNDLKIDWSIRFGFKNKVSPQDAAKTYYVILQQRKLCRRSTD